MFQVMEDWKFVGMVLDRLFLGIFTLAVIVGSGIIICQAPSLYDTRTPIDQKLSSISLKKLLQLPTDDFIIRHEF